MYTSREDDASTPSVRFFAVSCAQLMAAFMATQKAHFLVFAVETSSR